MIPIKYVCPLLVCSYAAHQVFNKLLPKQTPEQPICILFFIILLAAYAFYGVISFCCSLFEINEAKLHKIELLIGNGVAILCPILSSYLKVDEKEMYFIQFFLLSSTLVFFYLPYHRSSHYQLPAPFHKIHKLLLVTHGAMIYSLVMKQKADGTCFMQTVMWILSFVGIHEFWNIFRSELRVRRENVEPPVINNHINTIITMSLSPCPWNYEEDYEENHEEDEEEPPVPEAPTPEADDDFPDDVEEEPEVQNDGQNEEEHNLDALHERLRNMARNPPIFEQDATDCIVCTNGYSTTCFPVVLRCGHSICEECAGTLLAIGDGFIHCPFCRSVTMVYGSVRELPRNNALMQRIG